MGAVQAPGFNKDSTLWLAKIQNGYEIDFFTSVVDFTTAKAPGLTRFDKVQHEAAIGSSRIT